VYGLHKKLLAQLVIAQLFPP